MVVAALLGGLTTELGGGLDSAAAETGGAPAVETIDSIAAGRIDTGMDGTCLVRPAGWLHCWGGDATGQNGNGAINGEIASPFAGPTGVATPTAVAFRQVSRGGGHACGIGDVRLPNRLGYLHCWGDNFYGEALGSGGRYDDAQSTAAPAAGTVWSAVTAGLSHTCALNSAGTVWCWGFNGGGQLGQGDTTNRNSPTAVALPGGQRATAIAAGQGHTCAVLDDGRVACWGNGAQGQLGNGATDDIGDDETLSVANAIAPLPNGRRATAVTAGNDHTCALLDGGAITCWGLAINGRLGNGANAGTVLRPPAPITLPAPGTALAVSAGGSHGCALLANRRVSCWGGNADGKLGLGNDVDQLRPSGPIALPGNQPAAAVSAGDSHTCVLLVGDDVACFGSNQNGRSGYDAPEFIGDNETPAQQGTVDLAYAPTRFVPLAPRRLLDTRPAASIGYSGAKPGPGSTLRLALPADLAVGGAGFIGAVVLNVTVTEATGPGYVTVYPSTQLLPEASNLNIEAAGQTIANLVTVQVGADGAVSLYSFGGGHLIADLVGFYEQASIANAGRLETAPNPTRVLDTRPGAMINHTGGKPRAGETLVVPIAGRPGVPAAGLSAVVLNLTATEATGPGYFSVWPSGPPPNASNLNLERAGQTLPNQVIVPLGPDGAVRIFTERGAHLIVDVTGWFSDMTAPVSALGLFVPVSPLRHLDTRSGIRPGAGSTTDVGVEDTGHVAVAGVSAVAVNLTAVDAAGPGYVTAYPPGPTVPNASNLNLDRVGQVVANHATVRLANGRIRLFSERGSHLLVDVTGFYL